MSKKLYVLIAFVLLLPVFVFATHNMGKDLEYKYIGMSGGNLQYQVTVRYYRNCWDGNGVASSAPSQLTLNVLGVAPCNLTTSFTLPQDNSGTCPNKSGCQVTALCASQLSQSGCGWAGAGNPPYPGVEIYFYRAIITLPPGCNQILMGVTDCCRNGAISNIPNPGSTDGSIQALVNTNIDPNTNLPYSNSSVVFTTLPVTFVCANNPVTFNHGAVDPDGDSLVYTQVNPLQGSALPYTNISYNAGWTVNDPVKTNPPNAFGFDTQTGQLAFTPASTEQDVMAVRVDEYRNGILVGSTMRDIQLVVINCLVSIPNQDTISNVQNGNQTGGFTVQACPGTQVAMNILSTDLGGKNLTLTSNISGIPSPLPGATFDTLHVGSAPWDTVYARIRWTPTISDTGCHYFNIVSKNDDCPINGSSTKVFQVCVLKKVDVSPHYAVFCGTPIQLKATGGSNFSWTPAVGLSATNTYTPLASPVVDTKYTFTSDCGTDTALIISRPFFNMDAGTGGGICKNGQIQLSATVDNLYAPYQIVWQPATGLFDPVSGLPNNTVLNPVASPPSTTIYTVSFTGNNGCTRTDTVSVRVNGVAPAIVAKADPNNICPGTPVQLTIVANPSVCGVPAAICNGKNIAAVVNNSPTNQGGPGSQYPSPYGNFYKSARHQYLIKASELAALIGSGGQIKSVGLEIATLNSNSSLRDFTIQMGCTSLDSLTSYQNNLLTVFNPKVVTPVLGWNTHILDQFYDWDGVSNLIIDICFLNVSGGAINNKMKINTTAYRSQWFTWSNTQSMCGITGTQPNSPAYTNFFQRPSFQFNVCVADLSNANILWTPNSGPNAPNPLNNDTTIAHPIATTKYTANVIDANGCIGSDFVTVFVDTTLKLDVTPDTFICSLVPIQLKAKVTGNPLPGQQFTYTWTASVGTAPPSGTGAGFANQVVNPTQPTVYKCVVTGGSCTLSDTANVVVGTGLPVSLKIDSITCFGANNGKIKVVINGGGIPPITYIWNPAAANKDSITNLAPNTYSVTATDSKGCLGTATFTLNQPTPLTLTLDSVNPQCFGIKNGTVTATAGGGTPGYTYTWNPANTNTPTISGLQPGLYKLTVTDKNDCIITGQKNIKQPTAVTTTMQSFNATSNGGSDGKAKVTATGGTPGYTYTWSDGSTKDSVINKPAGTYYVTVCDANLCCIKDSSIITDPPPINLLFVTINNKCFGDSIGTASVSASGGIPPYKYKWSNTVVNDTITKLKAGVYLVTVSDSAGVTVTGNISITEPSQISISFDSTSILCNGGNNGALTANVSGGTPNYTYVWTGGTTANPKANLIAGTYSVTVKDGNNCTASATAALSQPDLLTASVTATDSTSCFGTSDGSASISVVGGTPNYSYAWDAGTSVTNSSTDLPAGNRTVNITDAHGCTTSVNFVIYQPAQIQLTVTPANANCATSNDGSATANIVGGTPVYTYNWDGIIGTNPQTNMSAGNHSVTITDANNCSVSTPFVVDTNYVLHVNIGATDASCFGSADGTATVTTINGNPGFSYIWSVSGGNTNTINANAGIVNVTVSDANNCSTTATTTINQPDSIAILLGKVDPSCTGKSDGYAWVSATGGSNSFTYAWNTNPPSYSDSIFNLPAADYSVTVTDNTNCTNANTITLINPISLTASYNQTDITCANANDGKGTIIASGGTQPYAYLWSDNFTGDVRNNITPGTYQITVEDSKKCDTILNVLYINPTQISFTSAIADSASCPNYKDGKISIVATGGTPGNPQSYTYSIDGINYQDNSVFDNLAKGTYKVYVKDANGCLTDTILTIDEPQELVFILEPIDSVGLGKSATLNPIINNYPSSQINGYSWTPADGLSCNDCAKPVASPYFETQYTLTIYYWSNCVAKGVVTVKVGGDPDFYIPNAFSPNGDGKNDILQVYGNGLKTVGLTIFNRWGEKVFDSDNQWIGWDGNYKGIAMNPGVYTYNAELEYLNGRKKHKFGSITLIR